MGSLLSFPLECGINLRIYKTKRSRKHAWIFEKERRGAHRAFCGSGGVPCPDDVHRTVAVACERLQHVCPAGGRMAARAARSRAGLPVAGARGVRWKILCELPAVPVVCAAAVCRFLRGGYAGPSDRAFHSGACRLVCGGAVPRGGRGARRAVLGAVFVSRHGLRSRCASRCL